MLRERGTLRTLVFVAATVAAAKLGYQEYLFRSATRDVIIGTYQDRALQTCQKHARSLSLATGTAAWVKPASISLAIGKSNLDVYFWQINSALWSARYRNPYLVIVAEEKLSHVFCEYDILHGVASVHRM